MFDYKTWPYKTWEFANSSIEREPAVSKLPAPCKQNAHPWVRNPEKIPYTENQLEIWTQPFT